MIEIQGRCADEFEPVRDVLVNALDGGDDLGASVAITIEGEAMVDLWGGWADEGRTTPWEEHTITNVWSTTKTVTALAALILVDRGELDLDAPVASYWPEFAANGKSDVEVRHLLSHTSGISGWEQPIVIEDIYDWDSATSRLAAQAPWWTPGTASGYHALNQGHLVGEVIRRVSGRSLKIFVAEEIAEPLGADFQIGLDPKDYGRVANVVPPPPMAMDPDGFDPDSPASKTLTGPVADATVAWSDEWRAADIGAANGHGNARSVARIQSIVANGGEVDGIRLLGAGTIDRIFDEQANGVDLVIGIPLRFGIGYALPQPDTFPYIPDGRVCFWGGWGRSMVVADTDRKLSIAYMMNRMQPGLVGNPTSAAIIAAAYQTLGAPMDTSR